MKKKKKMLDYTEPRLPQFLIASQEGDYFLQRVYNGVPPETYKSDSAEKY